MRVALCLSGVVGKLYTGRHGWPNTDENFNVDFRIGHHFYKKHIFDVNNDVDVFIQSWDVKYALELVELYNPKKSKFQKQIQFDRDDIYQKMAESRWYSTKVVTELKREYERENNFTYDVVMSSRFDVGIFKDLNFSKFNNLDTTMCVPMGLPINPTSVLDYWHFSSSKNMDIINNFYPHFEKYGCRSPHKDLYQWPTDNGIEIHRLDKFQESEMGNGDTEIIRAFFDNCEYREGDFNIENLKKLKQYPRGTRI